MEVYRDIGIQRVGGQRLEQIGLHKTMPTPEECIFGALCTKWNLVLA